MLAELKSAGKVIALATSKPRVFADRIAEHYNIAKYFDILSGSELNGTNNYKHEVINSILERLNNPDKSRIVMVGDRRQDVDGAKKCGIASIGVRFGYAEQGELESAGADFIVDDIMSLTELLLSL